MMCTIAATYNVGRWQQDSAHLHHLDLFYRKYCSLMKVITGPRLFIFHIIVPFSVSFEGLFVIFTTDR